MGVLGVSGDELQTVVYFERLLSYEIFLLEPNPSRQKTLFSPCWWAVIPSLMWPGHWKYAIFLSCLCLCFAHKETLNNGNQWVRLLPIKTRHHLVFFFFISLLSFPIPYLFPKLQPFYTYWTKNMPSIWFLLFITLQCLTDKHINTTECKYMLHL